MDREQLDQLWHKAMRESVEDGEMFTRYHFANLVAAHEREACAKVAENCFEGQGKHKIVIMAVEAAKAIRARGNT
jgi:hypothetical protein